MSCTQLISAIDTLVTTTDFLGESPLNDRKEASSVMEWDVRYKFVQPLEKWRTTLEPITKQSPSKVAKSQVEAECRLATLDHAAKLVQHWRSAFSVTMELERVQTRGNYGRFYREGMGLLSLSLSLSFSLSLLFAYLRIPTHTYAYIRIHTHTYAYIRTLTHAHMHTGADKNYVAFTRPYGPLKDMIGIKAFMYLLLNW